MSFQILFKLLFFCAVVFNRTLQNFEFYCLASPTAKWQHNCWQGCCAKKKCGNTRNNQPFSTALQSHF